jgi:N-methylhydantoinase A
MDKRYRIGIDIGGTFTDFAVVDGRDGVVHVEKVLTTPHEPERAVFEGLSKLGAVIPGLLYEAADVVHATTLVTNVVLEGKGDKTALITTHGFRDILEIGREVRYTVFDMFIRYPEPLVPRHLRFEVRERTLADGAVVEALDEPELRVIADKLRMAGVRAVAICFLHSYRNATNEEAAVRVLRELLPDIQISASHEVLPEPKEYERTSTTAVDAYVKRVVSRYLEQLEAGLRNDGYLNRLFVMLSNGGTAAVETAKRFPVQMLESGPAAGVEAATFFGNLAGLGTLLAFDMGGTTAKLCIVENGRAARTRAFEVARVHRFIAGSGYPVTIPVYDLLEIGAGGGSIARINDLRLIAVGPASAGSDPGPACYGLGGEEPTVTDADLVLGHLSPDYFLGGDMRLDRAAAERAINKTVASSSGLSVMEAAAGIYRIVNENMAAAARIYLAEKGQDVSRLTLVCSGGAGPVHAVDLARKLGIRTVVVPPFSGVMSSLGLLTAPLAFERSRTVHRLLDEASLTEIEAMFRELESSAAQFLPADLRPTFERTLEVRYLGQDYALEIAVSRDASTERSREQWKVDFFAAYEEQYGTVDDENAVELAALKVRAVQQSSRPLMQVAQGKKAAAPKGRRTVHVVNTGRTRDVAVYEREQLSLGQKIAGPAVIEERESTTVMGEGDSLMVDQFGCMVISLAGPQDEQKPAQFELAEAVGN